MDVRHEIDATERRVGDRTLEAGTARVVTLSRVFATDVDDLWEACTDPERLPRWFAPVHGDLRLGGRYQVEGNAAGTITACDPPHGFDATWEFGGQVSGIEVRTAAEGDGARLTLAHIAPVDDHWDTYGPGAVGIGWDLGLLGLAWHLAGRMGDPAEGMAWAGSDEGRAFITGTGRAWARADTEGGADAAGAGARAERTIAFFTGAEQPAGS